MKTIVYILLLFSVSINSKTFAQSISIKNDNDYSGFNTLDSSINANTNIYIAAIPQKHVKLNSDMLLKMFSYLNKKTGLKKIIIEDAYSVGFWANRYIQSGDTSALDILSKNELFPFFKELKEINNTLSDTNKISITGLDYELYKNEKLTFKALRFLLPDKEANDSIKTSIKAIHLVSNYLDSTGKYAYYSTRNFPYSISQTKIDLVSDFKKHPEEYAEYLGHSYTEYSRIIHAISKAINWSYSSYHISAQDHIQRTDFHLENFIQEYNSSGNKKVMMIFERCSYMSYYNKLECDYNGHNSFIRNLKDSFPNIKSTSIIFVYPNSTDRYLDNKTFKEGYLKYISKNDVGLFSNKHKPTYNYNLNNYDYTVVFNNDEGPYVPNRIRWSTRMYMGGDWTGTMITAGYGTRNFNFTPLNNALQNYPTKPQINSNLPTYSFGLHVVGIMYDSYRFNITQYATTRLALNDTSHIDLGGISTSFAYGRDIFPNSFLDITPHIGMRYGAIRISYTQNTSSSTNDEETIRYSMPFIGLDYNIIFQYRYKGVVGLGVELGQNGNLIGEGWKTNIPFVGNIDQTSKGYYMNLLLTINLSSGFNYYDPSKLEQW